MVNGFGSNVDVMVYCKPICVDCLKIVVVVEDEIVGDVLYSNG